MRITCRFRPANRPKIARATARTSNCVDRQSPPSDLARASIFRSPTDGALRLSFQLAALLLTVFCSATISAAQPAHVDRLQEAGLRCLAGAPAGVESVTLAAHARAPYLRSAFVEAWRRQGISVFETDSLGAAADRAAFRYDVEEVRIAFERAGSGVVARAARVSLHYMLIAPNGMILADELCSGETTDTLETEAIAGLVDARYPETDVEFERGGLFRRIIQPAVIFGAAVIGTYLFFNLRSKRTEGG